MAAPSNRNSIRIARGAYADLNADLNAIGEGEITYAIDENKFYVKQSGLLEPAAATSQQGGLADTATQPGDNISTLANDSGYITLADVTTTADNFVYVNSIDGDDGTGAIDDPGKPFLTIAAAIAAIPGPGHQVLISPGVYAEANPLVVPTGCILSSSHSTMGWLNDTVLITPLVNGSDTVQLSPSSSIEGVTVQGPSSAGFSAVSYAGENGTTASITNIALLGTTGGQGNGISCQSTGSGKIISFEIRFRGGEFKNFMQCLGGILATESVHVPNTGGTNSIETVFYQDVSINPALSRFQLQSCNTGNSNVTYVYRNNGGTCYFFNLNAFNADHGVFLENDSYNVNIMNGLLEVSGNTVVTSSSVVGTSGKLFISARMNEQFDIGNNSWWNSDHFFEFTSNADDINAYRQAKQLWGGDLIVGHQREEAGIFIGYGTAFSDPVTEKVFATSGNTSTTEGNGLVDITATALDKDDLTQFTFNANTADEAIYFCTTKRDPLNNLLKHYGYRTGHFAGDSRDGEYVFEIWSGAQWTSIPVQAVNRDFGYNYAENVMWRGDDSHEYIMFGLDDNTTWSLKTINGINSYWSRIRIVTAPSVLPTLYHIQGLPRGGFEITPTGKQVFYGVSQFRRSLQASSSSVSTTGGVLTGSQQIGTGTNQYTHSLANGTLDGAGDRMYWNIRVPEGTCTAFPFYVDILYSIASGFNAVTLPQMGFTFHAEEVAGMFVADPNGGLAPVARNNIDTELVITTNPQREVKDLPGDEANKMYNLFFGPFYASNFYEGDLITMALDYVDDGSSNADVNIWDFSIRSFRWTEGERQG